MQLILSLLNDCSEQDWTKTAEDIENILSPWKKEFLAQCSEGVPHFLGVEALENSYCPMTCVCNYTLSHVYQ